GRLVVDYCGGPMMGFGGSFKHSDKVLQQKSYFRRGLGACTHSPFRIYLPNGASSRLISARL
ncbi:MAG: hypothetical protein VX228_04095, partial [Pseudomonadota bacterium]|nr:hypothetical protein [Pseudomonadota bacterium]